MPRLALPVLLLLIVSCARDTATSVAPPVADVVFQVPTDGYDIYVYDVRTGTSTQITTLAGTGEFNPAFSPNGRSIVHDVVHFDPYFQDLYVTDIATGVSKPLVGGEGGNDADWSPWGLIAFDRLGSLYVVRASGGISRLVRAGGNDPQWNPAGTHLVFVDASDNSIRTIGLLSGREHIVAPFGVNPAWSADGTRIVYSDNFNLFLVNVNFAGVPLGPPRQLTFDVGQVFNQQPTWAGDGRSIAFHSNRGNEVFDWDLWQVSVSGGSPTRLTGTVGQGDFDPAYYQRKLVAFDGFTPGF
jgi:Tol biopolymer transport system component